MLLYNNPNERLDRLQPLQAFPQRDVLEMFIGFGEGGAVEKFFPVLIGKFNKTKSIHFNSMGKEYFFNY